MPKLPRVHFLLLAIVCFSVGITVPFAHGQTLASSAALSGSVSDQSGARIPNATVTLTNPEKGITRAFKTNDEGNFSFALLPAGTYTLTVEAAGFKTFKVQAITLEVGQSASQGISLTVGAAEQIEVTDTAPLLQVDNANVGAEISTKQVTELPLNRPTELVGQQQFTAANPPVGRRTGYGGPGRFLLQLRRRLLWNDGIPAGWRLGFHRQLGRRHLRSVSR